MRKNLRWILVGLVLLIVGLGVGVMFATRAAEPMPQAIAALQSNEQVQVKSDTWLEFEPRATEPTTGLIFYPGGLVDYRAYAPMARDIAANGYLVVIVPMPLNLAFFDANRASDVITKHPTIKSWTIGGHSLGGVAAAMFVKSHLDAVKGIAFWASYPADSMAYSRLKVLSISGTRDGLTTPAKIDASRALLPATAKFVAIDGGNHGQFGWYGLQSGDGTATISRESQQKQIVDATIDLLMRLSQ
jgi:pimeloyl-ACP methyl ester carboxylesterase